MRRHRLFVLMCFILVIYLGLISRIAYLQVIKGASIAREATAMRSKQIELKEYARGEILDRNLLPLTGTHTSTAVYCLPGEIIKNYSTGEQVYEKQVFLEIAQNISLAIGEEKQNDILSRLNNAAKTGAPFVRIAADLTDQEINRINSSRISGIVVAPISKRYSEDGFCSHVLGYVGGLENPEGKAGIEKIYDGILKDSQPSQELISVFDARGIAIQGLMFKVRQEQNEKKGSVVLTIDKRVQEIVEKEMNNSIKRGAVVVMDVQSKEILAMASRPTFNPYDDIGRLIAHDDKSTLLNRALTRYHPGSLFKMLVSIAALEEKTVSLEDSFYCSGKYVFNDQVSTSCWKEEGHGKVNFSQAFAGSCNPSFIQVGLNLGRQNLLHYAEKLHVTDERLAGYSLYHPGSYVKINPGKVALGNACLGQEGVMLTPLQITSLIATIADDGFWGPPSLVRYTSNRTGQRENITQGEKERVISLQTAQTMQQLMETTVSEGTGKTAALKEVKAAGKTATSQTGSIKEDGEEILNTWFGGYFPADSPRWAIVVLVEEGQSGAKDAAPVFKNIAQQILR